MRDSVVTPSYKHGKPISFLTNSLTKLIGILIAPQNFQNLFWQFFSGNFSDHSKRQLPEFYCPLLSFILPVLFTLFVDSFIFSELAKLCLLSNSSFAKVYPFWAYWFSQPVPPQEITPATLQPMEPAPHPAQILQKHKPNFRLREDV